MGRHVFGLAAVVFGFVTFAWHDYDAWHQLHHLWGIPLGRDWVYAAAIGQVLGGLGIQWRVTARFGAAILGIVYMVFALLWIPGIIAHPSTYDTWGNFFEQFSLVVGAFLIFATAAPRASQESTSRAGRVLFGVCAVSFTLEQAFYLNGTAGLVPAWLPPSSTFWAIATTFAFALAAIALLSGYFALLASRLLTLMIVLFGFFVWVPSLVAHPEQHVNSGAIAENFAIAGAAWILADVLGRARSSVV